VLAHNILRRHPMTSPSLSRWRTCRDLWWRTCRDLYRDYHEIGPRAIAMVSFSWFTAFASCRSVEPGPASITLYHAVG
jgi:hypothetical protein